MSEIKLQCIYDMGDYITAHQSGRLVSFWSQSSGEEVATVVAKPEEVREFARALLALAEEIDAAENTSPRESAVKIGDRVRVLEAAWAESSIGRVGTVTSVSETWRPRNGRVHKYRVDLDGDGLLYVERVELVEDVPGEKPASELPDDVAGRLEILKTARDALPLGASGTEIVRAARYLTGRQGNA